MHIQTQIVELLQRIGVLRTQTLYQVALARLGTDVSPLDRAPDMLGCAESVSELVRKVYPDFPIITGTSSLWRLLDMDPRFKKVSIPMPGAIIISPTGTAPTKMPGHVGIMGMGDQIMSNSSATGQFKQNYTMATWKARWGAAGFPIYFYQLTK